MTETVKRETSSPRGRLDRARPSGRERAVPRSGTGASAGRSRRDGAIDAARFVAFVAVVLIHTIDAGHYFDPNSAQAADPRLPIDAGQVIDQMARFAVPFFFVASGYFLARKDLSNVPASLWSIARRIVPVYAVWTAAFTLADPTARASLGQPGFWARLLTQGGTAPHLWFLPSVALCLGLLVVCNRVLSARGQFALAAGLFVLGLTGGDYFELLFGRSPSELQLHVVRDVAMFGFIFVTAGYWLARPGWGPTCGVAVAIFLSGGALHLGESWMFAAALKMRAFHSNEMLIGTLPFGIGAFLMARSWPPAWNVPRPMAALGTYGLGLYLIHPFFIDLLTSVVPAGTLFGRGLIAVGTVLLSVIAVVGLSRIRSLRKLLT